MERPSVAPPKAPQSLAFPPSGLKDSAIVSRLRGGLRLPSMIPEYPPSVIDARAGPQGSARGGRQQNRASLFYKLRTGLKTRLP